MEHITDEGLVERMELLSQFHRFNPKRILALMHTFQSENSKKLRERSHFAFLKV